MAPQVQGLTAVDRDSGELRDYFRRILFPSAGESHRTLPHLNAAQLMRAMDDPRPADHRAPGPGTTSFAGEGIPAWLAGLRSRPSVAASTAGLKLRAPVTSATPQTMATSAATPRFDRSRVIELSLRNQAERPTDPGTAAGRIVAARRTMTACCRRSRRSSWCW